MNRVVGRALGDPEVECFEPALGEKVRLFSHSVGAAPVFIEPMSRETMRTPEFLDWVRLHRNAIDDIITARGGVVFRRFGVRTTDDFDSLVSIFPTYEGGYRGGGFVRSRIKGNVLESTRIDPSIRIGIHSEMAYLRDYPARIAFFCKTASRSGGETIVCDMTEVTAKLPKSILRKMDRLGVLVVRNYAAWSDDPDAGRNLPDEMPWNRSFATDSKEEASVICTKMGIKPLWNDDGSLTLVSYLSGFTFHPFTGQKIYRSNMHTGGRLKLEGALKAAAERLRSKQGMVTGTFWGDGSPLTSEESGSISAVVDDSTKFWQWHDGDVMILDNLKVGHGRNPFEGEREVQVALLSA